MKVGLRLKWKLLEVRTIVAILCTSHRFESPFQSGTTVFIPMRSKILPNLRVLGFMLTFH